MRYIFLLVILILSSCAPLKKQITCEEKFYHILKKNSEEVRPFKISGTIFTGGVFFLFTGKFEKDKKISIFTPLGQKVVSVKYRTNREVCVLLKDKENCGIDTDILSEYIKTDIPFSLEDLLTGRFYIPEDSRYRCKKDHIIVNTGRYTIKFKGLKPEEVFYKNFSARYRYESGKIRSIFILRMMKR